MTSLPHPELRRCLRPMCLLAGLLLAAPALAAVATRDAFVIDPDWYLGIYNYEAHAATGAASVSGQRIARLANGGTLVATLVPWPTTGPEPGGHFNLGLVRYDAAGERVQWIGNPANPYFHDSRRSLVYPKTTNYGLNAVADLAVFEDRIFVLLQGTNFNGYEVAQLVVFRDNGDLLDHEFLPLQLALEPDHDVIPAGMVVYRAEGNTTSAKVLVVATRLNNPPFPNGQIRVMRLDLFDVSQQLIVDPIQGGDLVDLDFPTNVNWQGSNGCAPLCNGRAAAVVAPLSAATGDFVGGNGNRTLYIAGTVNGVQNEDAMVMKIAVNGDLQADFGLNGSGFAPVPFDQPGSDQDDVGIDVLVNRSTGSGGYSDTVWLLAGVDRSCSAGGGAARLLDDGSFDQAFGSAGRTVFGGDISPFGLCVNGRTTDTPHALARSTSILAVAGERRVVPQGCPIGQTCPTTVDATTYMLRLGTGELLDIRPQWPYLIGPVRIGDSALYDLLPDSLGGTSRFIGTGRARLEGSGAQPWRAATARFVSDRIFGSGF